MLQYSDLSHDDLEETIKLYETHLNSGGEIRFWLREGFDNPLYCGVKCTDGDKMVGMFSVRPGIVFTYHNEELAKQIGERWSGPELFTIDMVVVLPEYRRRGIARELLKRLHGRIVEKGGRRLLVEAWFRAEDSTAPLYGLLDEYFKKTEVVGKFDNFYKDLGKHGIACPECGSSCKCGAIVFIVEF